jgi:hypothetical protein
MVVDRGMSVVKKMKLFQLVIIAAFLATLVFPVANATINVQSVNIPDVVDSSSPFYGNCRFNIIVNKTTTQAESMAIPVVVNGTTLDIINVEMKANDISKIVAANVTLPRASVLITNPFAKFNPIPSNVQYAVATNPYMNPISSIQYNIEVGGFTKNVTVLVYADWAIWAIIVDIVVVAVTFFFVTRTLTT